ncbi:MAG: type II CRISPR RNA-guided endonuclease Cas9 [Xanthomonadaceae bacterium]|nr:type II CRISPR RNA-guided endonuclease Cas9 [Xanthomonadaceae bacterium]
MAKLDYRLGLDIGTNSIGWCVYALDTEGEPQRIVRMGSRIFSDGRDPKTLASLAASRRQARQARRRRDRVLKRRQKLMQALIEAGLMPADDAGRKAIQQEDPYQLRLKGLDEPLSLHQFGRALYHLCRKRGFKSSRKDRGDAEKEKESGKVKEAVKALQRRIDAAGCRTVGEYLGREHAQRRPVRARRSSDGNYVLYLQRDMVQDEFERLWAAQQAHHTNLLTQALHDTLIDILLFQRRLKPVLPGRCLFEEHEHRLPLCAPLQQRFRVLQELNNLRVKEGVGYRPLSLDERNRMRDLLLSEPKQVSFAKLAKAAGLGKATAFNLESEKRKGLNGDAASAQFSDPAALGEAWWSLPEPTQEALAVLVERADQDDALIQALQALPGDTAPARDILRPQPFEQHWLDALAQSPRIAPEQARAIARIRLPEDYGSLSRKALQRIVPELEREVVTYDIAVQRAGYAHHSQLHTGEFYKRMPYYGEVLRNYTAPAESAKDPEERRYGKIANPTVHIGLNQLRQLMNALIRRYGHPREIVVELAREFGLSGERRREIEREQADNQKRNEAFDRTLTALSQAPNRENRLRLRLWRELGEDDALDRVCVYSGRRIGMAMLFSDEVEIDHILPFSRSLHDGNGNKALCLRQANRDKGNSTPYEAFGHSPPGYDWAAIESRVQQLFAGSKHPATRRKAEHFREDALRHFLGDQDFLARHLTDTAYLSRVAKQYLSYVCHKDRVWTSTGKLTGMLRGKWGLNRMLSGDNLKNRNDHRHHALDAAVVGLCGRSLIQRVATAAARAETRGEHRLLENLAFPWPSFRDDLRDTLNKVVVSHKPDHGREAALHNDTHYGLRGEADKKGVPLVGRYVPLDSLKGVADLGGLADDGLRTRLQAVLEPLGSAKDIKAALQRFGESTGIRRVMKQERLSVIPIHDRRDRKPYRYVKGDGNYCYDIFLRDDGRWDGRVATLYEANQWPEREAESTPKFDGEGRPLLMRLRKGDILMTEIDGRAQLLRITRFTEGMIALVASNEANVDMRARNKDLRYLFKAPSALKQIQARVVGVDILGYVNDPGFTP